MYTADMTKKLLIQIGAPLIVLICLMLLTTGILAIFGQVHVDTDGGSLGLYNSSNAGWAPYYNPLINLVWIAEMFGLVALPIVLFLLRKRLRCNIWPWLFCALGVLFAWFNYQIGDYDPEVTSTFPYFLHYQLWPLGGLVVGAIIAGLLSNKHASA